MKSPYQCSISLCRTRHEGPPRMRCSFGMKSKEPSPNRGKDTWQDMHRRPSVFLTRSFLQIGQTKSSDIIPGTSGAVHHYRTEVLFCDARAIVHRVQPEPAR